MIGRFGGVADKRALVEALRGGERGRIAEQHFEKFQALDMAAEHHEADGERRRQQEAERPLQPGPEHRGTDHRDRG